MRIAECKMKNDRVNGHPEQREGSRFFASLRMTFVILHSAFYILQFALDREGFCAKR